ncbi:DNA polymerase III alpha subunit [hydrothermal vent metagenome]|uniref:DNA polymerase III alpha subunit n=1 Tax=hydrothermal vent metagenome TaxID=652676 RepID=A0A3B1BJ90_9ZZZZ
MIKTNSHAGHPDFALSMETPDQARGDNRRHNAIRIGLAQIKGLSISSIRSIIEGRGVRPYSSIPDFLLRSRVKPKEAEALALCGALDMFGATRPEILWKAMMSGPGLASPPTLIEAGFTAPPLADYPVEEKLEREREILGVTVSSHPIRVFTKVAEASGVIPASRLCHMIGKQVRVIGWLVTAKRTRTKHGEYMKFLTLEDESDIFEVTLFPKVYARFGGRLQGRGPYIVLGEVENDGGYVTLAAQALRNIGAKTRGAPAASGQGVFDTKYNKYSHR